MLERQERKALFLLIGVVAVVLAAHLLLDAFAKPIAASPYSEAAEDGALVILEGPIETMTVTKTGGHLLLTVAGVPIFVPADVAGGIDVRQGDLITLYGTLQTYQGKKEIVVHSPGDIRILE
ncbi:hypothetical protein FGU65_08475 [Methanoculleus sp. FWC-SCC1]|uniref:Uncharacterized protein n=1 Tax=Methanoculleus frigidifontis TaxID=2584085 RepID=A0ABT8MAF4_9EURY|nr:hypothetical protein [Methanoculleus sp. FWC-SCC1]MDN7024921.1 hypothetical protein [Methanoculleus sp. FWC-SCC1]